LAEAVEELGKDGFRALVEKWHNNYVALRPKIRGKDNPMWTEYLADREASLIQ
jgi:hypothetical protein